MDINWWFDLKFLFLYTLLQLIHTGISVDYDGQYFLRREHSFMKPYQLDHWNILGHTIISSNFVRLTPDESSKFGHIWNRVPCPMHNWEIHINFKVHGRDTGDLHGDGFAVWYAREPMQSGPIFGSKDFYQGLGIFFDTYSNQNGPHAHVHPYISSMVNNGTQHYDHDHDGTHTQLGGCTTLFRNIKTDTFAAIRYANNTLTVSTDIKGDGKWQECFSVSGVLLPTGFYFGATAVTGDLSDAHDIISFRVYDLDPDTEAAKDYSAVQPSAANAEQERAHVEDIPPFFTPFIKRLLVVVIVCVTIGAIAFGAIVWWQSNEQFKSKRFY